MNENPLAPRKDDNKDGANTEPEKQIDRLGGWAVAIWRDAGKQQPPKHQAIDCEHRNPGRLH